jgi:hypothetical protein
MKRALLLLCGLLYLTSATSVLAEPFSKKEARDLAQIATRIYYNDLIAVDVAEQPESDFYLFEVLWTNQGSNGSPHFGAFAVNKQTGDVWDVAGYCTLLHSKNLTEAQQRLRTKLGAADLRNHEKPQCDAS